MVWRIREMNEPMNMFVGSREESINALETFGEGACRYYGRRWPHHCDCKYGLGRGAKKAGETSGCPELMSIHAILSAMTDAEWLELSKRGQNTIVCKTCYGDDCEEHIDAASPRLDPKAWKQSRYLRSLAEALRDDGKPREDDADDF